MLPAKNVSGFTLAGPLCRCGINMQWLTLTRDAKSQRRTLSLSQKADAGRQMMLHSRPTVGWVISVTLLSTGSLTHKYTDIHKHPLVDPRTKLLV